jgi:hypothetical protein
MKTNVEGCYPDKQDLPTDEFFEELERLYKKYGVYICPPCEHDGLHIRLLEKGDIEHLREIEFSPEAANHFMLGEV